MINQDHIEVIKRFAYVPEHIPSYVTSISESEPFWLEDFLIYFKKDHLIFIGYPLSGVLKEERIKMVLHESIIRFKPKIISISSPFVLFPNHQCIRFSYDDYYRLDLFNLTISQKNRNMIQRASRELFIEKTRNYNDENQKIVDTFIETHPLNEESKFIFKRIKEYLSSSHESWIFNVKNLKGELVAFDIAEFGSKDYAFYMFNFRSKSIYIPGASDLLLYEIIKTAMVENKRYLNLGLGINKGIIFFKKKWGGHPFLSHFYCLYKPSKEYSIERLIEKL